MIISSRSRFKLLSRSFKLSLKSAIIGLLGLGTSVLFISKLLRLSLGRVITSIKLIKQLLLPEATGAAVISDSGLS